MTTSAAKREAARAKQEFPMGARVRVQLGARFHDAVVVEHRNGRVWVNIHIAGGDEPMLSSYAPHQLEHAS